MSIDLKVLLYHECHDIIGSRSPNPHSVQQYEERYEARYTPGIIKDRKGEPFRFNAFRGPEMADEIHFIKNVLEDIAALEIASLTCTFHDVDYGNGYSTKRKNSWNDQELVELVFEYFCKAQGITYVPNTEKRWKKEEGE